MKAYKYSFRNLLQVAYPQEDWSQVHLTSRTKKSRQRWLFLSLRRLFPGREIIEESVILKNIEVDIWIPSLSLAVEFQGEQHYHDVPLFSPIELYKLRDENKRIVCQENDVKLLTIPYWWDNSIESLHATIFEKFPKLIEPPDNSNRATAIPDAPEKSKNIDKELEFKAYSRSNVISDVDNIDISGRYLRQRLGLFAFWNGSELLQHTGKPFRVPGGSLLRQKFSAINQKIIGELFIPESSVEAVTRATNSPQEDTWDTIQFHACDIPDKIETVPFSRRLEQLRENAQRWNIPIASYFQCNSTKELIFVLEKENNSDFILMNEEPSVSGASFGIIPARLKTIYCTMNQVVETEYQKHIIATTMDGKTLNIRCTEGQSKNPPAEGAIIKVGYLRQAENGDIQYPYLISETTETSVHNEIIELIQF